MTGTVRYLCVLLFLACAVQAACGAINVQNVVVNPSGDLTSGKSPPNQVRVSYVINFVPEGGMTFSADSDLIMYTDMDNAHWSYSTVLDGIAAAPLTAVGRSVTIDGWDLSYPTRRSLSLQVNMTGDVPALTASARKIVVRVYEYSSGIELNPARSLLREANVILPGSPVVSQTTGSPNYPTVATPAPTTPAETAAPPDGTGGPGASSLAVPSTVLALVFLLIAFIPLGLLVFHDHFGLGRYPLDLPVRELVTATVLLVLCGAGFVYVLVEVLGQYVAIAGAAGSGPVWALPVILLAGFTALSSFTLAIGSYKAHAFRWTLRVHGIAAILALIAAPVCLYLLGNTAGSPGFRPVPVAVAIVAALLSFLIVTWQDHAVRPGESRIFSRISGIFRRRGHVPHESAGENPAIAILNERLAKGEITLEDYAKLKDAIKK